MSHKSNIQIISTAVVLNLTFFRHFAFISFALTLGMIASGCGYSSKTHVEHKALQYEASDIVVDDMVIKHKIATKIREYNKTLYSSITIVVSNGSVKFLGEVNKPQEMIKCIEIASSENGVREIKNYLSVNNSSYGFDITQYAQDSFITATIQGKVLFAKNIDAKRFSFTTHRGIVYIFGITNSSKEVKEIADISSKITGVSKVVVNVKFLK